MNLETLRDFCKSLPFVTEDIKWQHDLCFMVAGKIFCITSFDSPLMVSLKVDDEEFEELAAREGIVPAPYLARYRWVLVKDQSVFNKKEWEHYISQSYELVKAKIPQKKFELYMKESDVTKRKKTKNKKR